MKQLEEITEVSPDDELREILPSEAEDLLASMKEEGKKAQEALLNDLYSRLEDSYHEKFEVVGSLTSIGDLSMRFDIRPEADPEVVFNARYEGEDFREDYVRRTVLRKLEKKIEQVIPAARVSLTLLGNENDRIKEKDLTVSAYLELLREPEQGTKFSPAGEVRLLLDMAVCGASEEMVPEIRDTLIALNREYHLSIAAGLWFITEEGLAEAVEHLKKKPTLKSTFLREKNPSKTITFLVTEGVCKYYTEEVD